MIFRINTIGQDAGPDYQLNAYYAPKIYPSFIQEFCNFQELDGDYSNDPMTFKTPDEEMYIVGDVETDGTTTIDNELEIPRIINVESELLEIGGGYHSYYNDLIVSGTLELSNCVVNRLGTGNNVGTIYVIDNGKVDFDYVLLNELKVGIYQIGTGNTSDIYQTTIANSINGVYLGTDADMTIRYSNIGITGNDIIQNRLVQGGYGATFLLKNGGENYYNNITYTSTYHGLDNPYELVYVGGNYWGSPNESDKYLIFDDVQNAPDWYARLLTSYSNESFPISKVANSSYDWANYFESIKDWSNAKNSYLSAISQSDDSMLNKRSLNGLLRIYSEQEWNADDLRIIAHDEYSKALNKHKPTFDFLYNETYVAEGDFFTAIEMFDKCAKKYAGTSVEVRMLSRVANIYGDYLDDPATAKRYADRAAALNPGQPILLSAYWSAGIQYEPSEYANKFEDVLEYYDIPDEHDTELATESDITVSPNPFNPSTVIGYTLISPSHVELSIFSITGQKVATLVNGHVPAGRHSVIFDGANLASGIYFYRFESDALNKTGKLMLMK